MKFNVIPIFFLFFILLQTFFTYKGVETFPFLNYGMYSAPLNKPDSIELLTLRINGKNCNLAELPQLSEAYLQYNLHYYKNWQQNGYTSGVEATLRNRFEGRISAAALQGWIRQLCNAPEQEKAFGNWLAAYIQASIQEPIERIELIQQYYSRTKPYNPLSIYVWHLYPPR